MKPRNFPGRKLRRTARAALSAGADLTPAQRKSLEQPKDIRCRPGKSRRTAEGLLP